MSVPPNKERRAVPRFKVSAACSVLPRINDEVFREQAILGQVKDISRDAVAVVLPTNETYGADASSLGKQVQVTLALPIGYVRLLATLIRYAPDDSGNYFFVFRIQESKERKQYNEYLATLQAELSGAPKDIPRSRLATIETKLRPD